MLMRAVVGRALAEARMAKIVALCSLQGREVFLDGYNVLITVESLLAGNPVICCDDGFLRDTRGVFGRYRQSGLTTPALSEILDLLARATPAFAHILLDRQMSRSGELAGNIRAMLAERNLAGTARTARDVDRQLKAAIGIVATSDGNVIDASSEVIDLPAEIARRRGICPLGLLGPGE